MRRLEALRTIYPRLKEHVVVTNMGAVAVEVYSLGHRPILFYLELSMGLASSVGPGLALCLPQQRVTVLDGVASTSGIRYVAAPAALEDLDTAFAAAEERGAFSVLVAKVEAVGPVSFRMDIGLLENRFQFERYLRGLKDGK